MRAGFLAGACLGALVGVSTGASAQAPRSSAVDLAARASPATLVYSEVRDIAALARAWSADSPWGRLAADPEVREFFGPLLDTTDETVAALRDAIVGAGGTTDVFRGRASLAIEAVASDEPSALPAITIGLTGVTDRAAARQTIRVLFDALAARFEATVEPVDVGGTEGLTLRWADRFALYACVGEHALWIGNRTDTLAASLRPRVRSLRDRPEFQRAAMRVEADTAHHFAYVDVTAVIGALDGVLGRGYPEYGFLVRTFDLERVHTIAIACQVVDGGFRERGYVGGKGAAADALVPESGLTSPGAIRGDVVAWVGERFDAPKWCAWLRDTLERAGHELDLAPAVRLGAQLAGWLDGDEGAWVTTLVGELGFGIALPSAGVVPRAWLLASTPDPAATEQAVRRLGESAGWRRIRDRDHTLSWRRGFGPIDVIHPAMTVARGWLAAASTPSALRRWLRKRSAPLATRPEFTRALAQLGLTDLDDAKAAAWVDVPRLVAFAMNNVAPMIEGWEPMRLPWFGRPVELDWSRLPSTETMTAAFRPAIVVIRRIDDGFGIDAFGPLPYAGIAWGFSQGSLVTGLSGTVDASVTTPTSIPGELGVTVDDMHRGRGCRIVSVAEGTAAARAGLAAWDVIVAIGDEAVAHVDDAVAALRGRSAGDTVRLRIARGNDTLVVEARLRPRR